jgi:hypothetical protein
MLNVLHLGNQVCPLYQFGIGIAAGEDELYIGRPIT